MDERPEQPEEQSGDTQRPEEQSTLRQSAAMIGSKGADAMIGLTVGRYTIKRVIGSGGMGTVYEAIQQSPRRNVALKMLKQGIASRSALRRFEYEAQTLGRLRHQHIAQIYEAGTLDDGVDSRPYFAMEYLVGAKSLTQYARDKKLGTHERLALFMKVCDAVQHGHQKGIIHRDLKPGNILVTSNGVPKIIDFGVARSTDSDMAITTLQTDLGALIGTLQYMSPEQCAADPEDIDTRSDVYALGVVLYELLCESLPYDVTRVAIAEAARIVQQEEPTKPSTVDKRLRGDIETIALKALEKDRDHRYQSAMELEQDINRYLAGEAILARSPGAIDFLKRFARKHKAAAIAIANIFMVLVAAIIVIAMFAIQAERERERAQEQVLAAEQAQINALKAAYFGYIHAAAAAISNNSYDSASQRLEDAYRAVWLQDLVGSEELVVRQNPPGQLPFEWQYLKAQSDDAFDLIDFGERSICALSPDGTQVLAWSNLDETLHLMETATGKELHTLTTRFGDLNFFDELYPHFVFSPDSTRLAIGSRGGLIYLWDTTTGKELSPLWGHEEGVMSITFNPDGTRLAAGSHDGTIRIWDVTTGEVIATMEGHAGPVSSIAFNPDGTRLLSGGNDATVRNWDTESGKELLACQGSEHIYQVDFIQENLVSISNTSFRLFAVEDTCEPCNHEGLFRPIPIAQHTYFNSEGDPRAISFAVAQKDGSISLFDSEKMMPKCWQDETWDAWRRLSGDPTSSIGFSPDGSRLVLGGIGGTLRFLDSETGDELCTLSGHHDWIIDFVFSSDGTKLTSVGGDNTARIWDADITEQIHAFEQTDSLKEVAYSPDSTQLALACWSGDIRILNTSTGKEIASIHTGKKASVNFVTFSPDGTRLASGGGRVDKNIQVWDTATGEKLNEWHIDERHSSLTLLAFSPDGTQLAIGNSHGTVMLWDVVTGEERATLQEHDEFITTIVFTNDGSRLVTGSADGSIREWDIETGKVLDSMQLQSSRRPKYNRNLVLSPDGTQLAWDDGDIIWLGTLGTDTGLALRQLLEHDGTEMKFSFNHEGTRLATGNYHGTILLWDTETGEEVLELVRRSSSSVSSVNFSPDGTQLASTGYENVIDLWNTRPRSEVAQDRRLTQQREKQLNPLVESWIEKTDGDSDLVIAMLQREGKNRPAEEQVTLRNLVLKNLTEHRQPDERVDLLLLRESLEAAESEEAEPAVP